MVNIDFACSQIMELIMKTRKCDNEVFHSKRK